MREQNEELLKENTVLRSQFEDAIKITKQLESVHEQNRDLLQQVRTLKQERDDLEHRLDISLETIKEMNAKLNDEKRSCTSIRGTDLHSMNKEIEKVKLQSKAQLDAIYDQLEKSKQATERESVEKRLLASKLDHILEDAKRYFSTTFNNVDDFISFLSSPPTVQEVPAIVPASIQSISRSTGLQNCAKNDGALERKLKHLKKQLKSSNESNLALEQQLKRCQSEFNGERSELRAQLRDLEGQVASLNDQKDQVENQLNYQVTALNQKNALLNKKIDSLTDQLQQTVSELKKAKKEQKNSLNAQQQQQQQQVQKQPQCDEEGAPKQHQPTQGQIVYNAPGVIDDAILEKNAQLTNDLAVANKKLNQLTDQLKSCSTRSTELSVAFEKAKADVDALQHVHDADVREIESLRSALHIKEVAEQEIREKQKALAKQPSARVLKLQRALESEKQKVYTLQNNETKLNSRIEDLEASLRLANQTTQECEDEAKKARSDLNEYRRRAEAQAPPSADDLLPPCVFRCDEFDPTLSSAIVRIANNAALQPASKLQNCFKTIRKHYTKQIAERDAALDQAFSENQTLSNSFNQFLVDASIALNDNAITLQDFFSENAGRRLVDQIAALRADQGNLRHQLESIRTFVATFQTTFGEFLSEPSDLHAQVNEIRGVIDMQKTAILARSKKIHELKNLVRSQNAAMKSAQIDFENKIHELEDTSKELQATISTLKVENKKLSGQVRDLNNELQTVTAEREQLETTIMQEQESLNTTMLEEISKSEKKLKEQLKLKAEQVHSLKQTIECYEAEVNKQKALINQLKLARHQRDQEYAELQRVMNEHDESAAERLEAEKRSITSSFENALNELKDQCEKHRLDVQKMAAQLSDTELKNAKLNQDINQVRKEKRKMEVEVATIKAQTEREKKLMESTIRAQKIQTEAQYNTKLEEQRTRAENEKRRLFAIGTDAFRSYFNPSEQIDERSFKAVLDNARDTIQSLQNSDTAIRRMLGVHDAQTTQDAVAQLLMGGCTA
ncbi:hypothetical protein TRFO_11810 [Tritrichomonas foetus]|uniref:Uncharacterized protein n=1 Tax=Tritrichomonas foetus TaxID=1144522 RepID=A0A1J4J5I9_9EUKA|nr:hypothetical protein [Tritrichomonas foetus]OHS93399.1 hypothetical protein TRFO_11810 [Tritrichomonas foetus]|eukprot:OHS93399.1 hypothetical protein TRFO_11810 [Tritrichomonas foetus]